MQARPASKKVTYRTSGRKCPVIDYSQYELTEDPPSLPKKKRKVDLKHKPSALRLAAKKYRTKLANTPRPVRQCTTNPVTMNVNKDEPVASTSAGTGTLMKLVTKQETEVVIKQMLDLNAMPEDDDNDNTVPLLPQSPQATNTVTPGTVGTNVDIKPQMLPRILGTVIRVEDVPMAKTSDQSKGKKKVFKTIEYKLKRKYVKLRKFSCVGCNSKFNTQKELNEHFRDQHPQVKCDLCEKFFDTSAAMLHHKYKHYKYMYECKTCGRGFQFASQLREHNHVHQSLGDWVCSKPKCAKRFKRESELNAHLVAHSNVKLKCDHCTYKNPMNTHARTQR